MAIITIEYDLIHKKIATVIPKQTVTIGTLRNLSIIDITTYNYFTSLYACRFQPNYALQRDKCFICGGLSGQLILNRKTWLLNREQVIHEGEGAIQCIEWNKDGYIAWTNNYGVKIYDIEREEKISYIERPIDCPPLELCRCTLLWKTNEILLIGWGNTVKLVQITKQMDAKKTAVIHTAFEYDFFLAGMVLWNDDSIVVFGYRPMEQIDSNNSNKETELAYPELHIIDLGTGETISSDALPMLGYDQLRASDYRIVSSSKYMSLNHSNEAVFYLIAPKDAILGRVRDLYDRIQWFIETKQYEKAIDLSIINREMVTNEQMKELIRYYITSLFVKEDYEKAAGECQRLLETNKELWEKYVYLFAQRNQLTAILPYLPTMNPRLSPAIYDMVLKHLLENHPKGLLETLRKWKSSRDVVSKTSNGELEEMVVRPLYDAHQWIIILQNVIRRKQASEKPSSSILSYYEEALAELYISTGKLKEALTVLFKLGARCTSSSRIFWLVTTFELWNHIQDKIVELYEINYEKTLELLTEYSSHFEINDVVEQLKSEKTKRLLHDYLDMMMTSHSSEYNQEKYAPIHTMQLALYAEFAPSNLLTFIKTTNLISLDEAYNYCLHSDPPLWNALVYILGRMGKDEEALELLIRRRNDVSGAIEFIKSSETPLYDLLIELCLKDVETLAQLVNSASKHELDPLKVFPVIPETISIPQLSQMTRFCLSNYQLQLILYENASQLFQSDRYKAFQKGLAQKKCALRLTSKEKCSICEHTLTSPPLMRTILKRREMNPLILFHCGHSYHRNCYEDYTDIWRRKEETIEEKGCILCKGGIQGEKVKDPIISRIQRERPNIIRRKHLLASEKTLSYYMKSTG